MNQPWVYMCSTSWTPLPPSSPSHLSGSSQCTSPELPVSCIEPGLAIYFTYGNIHVSMLFSKIIPPSPSLTDSKFCALSLCLLLSHIFKLCCRHLLYTLDINPIGSLWVANIFCHSLGCLFTLLRMSCDTWKFCIFFESKCIYFWLFPVPLVSYLMNYEQAQVVEMFTDIFLHIYRLAPKCRLWLILY